MVRINTHAPGRLADPDWDDVMNVDADGARRSLLGCGAEFDGDRVDQQVAGAVEGYRSAVPAFGQSLDQGGETFRGRGVVDVGGYGADISSLPDEVSMSVFQEWVDAASRSRRSVWNTALARSSPQAMDLATIANTIAAFEPVSMPGLGTPVGFNRGGSPRERPRLGNPHRQHSDAAETRSAPDS